MPSPADAAPALLWVPELGEPGSTFRLGADDARYLTRVCRARPGERFTLTDGRGATARAVLIRSGQEAEARIEACERGRRQRECWVLCGAPERGRADWMVEKLAELSVSRLIPVDFQRTVWGSSKARLPRWRRLAVAALRQSRGRFLLETPEPVRLETALESLPTESARWEAHPGGVAAGTLQPSGAGIDVGLIGPSPGLEERERRLLGELGFRPIALSDGRLRTETAALVWAGWWAGLVPERGTRGG